MAAILGLMAVMAVTRWGGYALTTASAQGFSRSLTMSLHLARRQAIAEGTPAAVVLNRTGGDVTSIQLVRAGSSGDEPTDEELPVPDKVTLTASSDRWEYDYTGSLTSPAGGGTLGIADGDWNWDLTVNGVTGHIEVIKAQ